MRACVCLFKSACLRSRHARPRPSPLPELVLILCIYSPRARVSRHYHHNNRYHHRRPRRLQSESFSRNSKYARACKFCGKRPSVGEEGDSATLSLCSSEQKDFAYSYLYAMLISCLITFEESCNSAVGPCFIASLAAKVFPYLPT